MELLEPAERRVLRALDRRDAGLSGRALARVTGLTQSSAQRALVRLRARGVVLAEPVPPALTYRINRDHVAWTALAELVDLPERLRQRAAALIERWTVPPVSAILYGSVARGEASPGSDVDVLLVRPAGIRTDESTWQEQVAALGDAVRRWTGLPASVIELSVTEARRGLAGGEGYLLDAAATGLVVAGQPLRQIGRRAG